MKRLLVVLLLVFVLVACNPKGATNVLEIEGYTDIEITGYDFLSCSDSDIFSTGFIATNPQGVRIIRALVQLKTFNQDELTILQESVKNHKLTQEELSQIVKARTSEKEE